MAKIVSEHWTPCPAGELDRLETHLRLRHLWQTLGMVAAIVAVAITVAVAGWVVADAIRHESRSASPACPPAAPVECHE